MSKNVLALNLVAIYVPQSTSKAYVTSIYAPYSAAETYIKSIFVPQNTSEINLYNLFLHPCSFDSQSFERYVRGKLKISKLVLPSPSEEIYVYQPKGWIT